MSECLKCGFYDMDTGCGCPSADMWYACPIESAKPENIQALKEYAEWAQHRADSLNRTPDTHLTAWTALLDRVNRARPRRTAEDAEKAKRQAHGHKDD